jgi:hypothetical protein
MLPSAISLCAVVAVSMLSFDANAEAVLKTLKHNPFSRPGILKAKPRAQNQASKPAPAPQKIDFELTATMVSQSTPMVVVDGRVLGIGDKIKGFELIAVTEGGAVFTRQGKKYSLTVADESDESRPDY